MFGIDLAAWLAGSALGRFWNKDTAKAIAVVVVALAVLIGGILVWRAIGAAAVAANDAGWRAKAAAAAYAERGRQLAVNSRAEAAAAAEREVYVGQIRDMAEHAVTLEAELARLKGVDGDPIIYPKSLARELRK